VATAWAWASNDECTQVLPDGLEHDDLEDPSPASAAYARSSASPTLRVSTPRRSGKRHASSGSQQSGPAWDNSTIISGDPVERVRALKQQDGLDIVVTGSITLTHALIRAGLVDEYRLFVYPSVQGRGRRLFPDGHEIPLLRLVDAKTFRSGVTLQRYASASPTTTGPL
jgi:riboflavin biosynthesis pyrimidine reductase